MVSKLSLKNFRGVRNAEIEIAPITVLTGYNNAGKSTIPYALLTLKNVLSNPNQPLDSFFNLGFLNLSGFKQVVFSKDDDQTISLGISATEGDAVVDFELALGKHTPHFALRSHRPFPSSLKLDVTFPYALNLGAAETIFFDGAAFKASWNGLAVTLAPLSPEEAREKLAAGQLSPDAEKAQNPQVMKRIATVLNMPSEEIRRTDMVPLRRGFTKPVYAAVSIQPQLLTEEEVATALANEPDMLGRVDLAMEQIVNRNLRVHVPLGTATFYLHSRDRQTGMTCELVNEGFGTNQLAFLFAKMYRDGVGCVCIEEPEIHLHPTAILKFADLISNIAKSSLRIHKRQFILTTHSEHLVASFLGLVARGEFPAKDLAVYYVTKSGEETIFERCQVTEKGQIEGGLKGFYEAELAAVKTLLGNSTGHE